MTQPSFSKVLEIQSKNLWDVFRAHSHPEARLNTHRHIQSASAGRQVKFLTCLCVNDRNYLGFAVCSSLTLGNVMSRACMSES